METPDWNKLAGVDEAAAKLKASASTKEERDTVLRILKDFATLPDTGKLVVAMFVTISIQALPKP